VKLAFLLITAAVLAAGCGKKDDAVAQAEKKEGEEALRPGNGAVETEGARLEIDRPREHDAYDEQPEHASTGTQQQGRAARMGGGAFSRNRLTKGIKSGIAHDPKCRQIRPGSNGSEMLFRAATEKVLSQCDRQTEVSSS
jgi:hypothetical protein